MENTVRMVMDKTEIPVVAIDEMNKTHEREADLVNSLFEMISAHQSGTPASDALTAAVSDFRDHMERHFSREEEMMEQAGFPAFHVHKREHDRVRAELDAILAPLHTSNDFSPLADYLQNTHPDWAKNHIATMDTMTAFYIVRSAS